MERGAPVERLWWSRLRWRMRGAWMWPAFFALTVVDGLLLHRLPVAGNGPGGIVPALLLAGFANLFVVAVLAPLVGRRVRRARPDLPKLIADDYSGTTLILVLAAGLAVAGLAHRPAVLAERADEQAVASRVHDYVSRTAPRDYVPGLAAADSMRVEDDLYRTCVPGPDPKRWLCMFVSTDQSPAGLRLDSDRAPNDVYRTQGGFR